MVTLQENLNFSSTKEFNEVWEAFVVEKSQQKWRTPKCKITDEHGERYFQTERFRWCANSMEMWVKYRSAYLLVK